MFGSSWSGQSALMVQRECSDHELTLLHLSLISPLPYMSLLSCSVLTRSTEIQQRVWPAGSAGQLWILRFPKRLLNIVYVILCFVRKEKGFDKQKVLSIIREDCQKNLKDLGDPKVFLISS
ncbi:hypothetical protein G5714_002861 [Onychostoma macrolepis]|uniref:Uncharacterized protein n=1 Tax=Onychostoma macrolepis TaxID=369639 RepID=A0A7J6D896_9TELE|nr:hypothetical protein G5714_002861 [Onychostoma macrolepis]